MFVSHISLYRYCNREKKKNGSSTGPPLKTSNEPDDDGPFWGGQNGQNRRKGGLEGLFCATGANM
ncbi:MAG: hypothetical protein D3923_15925 [Candidatus Electrothrix sp. AR3]|nr:hypothetical protein [Candidatus Electrothrix sp. AR3]